jgi:hypothetical protein
MQILKWFKESSWEQNVTLGSIPFILNGNYNVRDSSWVLNVFTNDKIPLVLGRKLVLNTNILANAHGESKPKGILLVVPITRDVENVTRDNIGIEVEIIFIGDDEVF